MPKFSDTVLFHVNRYSDTTKQIKRFIYESILDAGCAPKVAAICTEFGLPEATVRASLHDLEGGIIIAMQNPQHLHLHEFMGQKLPDAQRAARAGRDLLRPALRQFREPPQDLRR